MKKCFKCGETKSLSDFYKHSGMSDGHLNKCKKCAKIDVKTANRKNRENHLYVGKERARGREKYKRLYKGVKRNNRSPFLRNLSRKVKNHGINTKGFELHHPDISIENDVIMMHSSVHALVHSTRTDNDLALARFWSMALGVDLPVRIIIPYAQ